VRISYTGITSFETWSRHTERIPLITYSVVKHKLLDILTVQQQVKLVMQLGTRHGTSMEREMRSDATDSEPLVTDTDNNEDAVMTS